MKNLIFLLPVSLFLISCTNYQIVERCKQTDWHRLGVMSGMKGLTKPSAEDSRNFQMCVDEGQKPNFAAFDNGLKEGIKRYCTAEASEKRGSLGLDYNFELCTEKNRVELLSSYNEGVKKYCLSSGYSAGLSGKPMQVSCPKETHGTFNPEFQRGRTDYLVGSVERLSSQVSNMSEHISRLEEKNKDLDFRNQQLDRKNQDLERELEDTKRKITR
jgi:hypothetical protein